MVADDDRLASQTLRTYLSGSTSIQVVGVAPDGRAAVQLAHEWKPDVAIVDMHMPHLDGIEVTRQITGEPLMCRVLIFTAMADEQVLAKALAAGATGFLLKSDHPHMVINGVLSAYSGDTLVSPKLVTSLLPLLRRSVPPRDLPGRDRQLIALIGKGLSNADIAQEMHLAVSTVKSYVSRLLQRLDRPNRTALAALAYEWNLLDE